MLYSSQEIRDAQIMLKEFAEGNLPLDVDHHRLWKAKYGKSIHWGTRSFNLLHPNSCNVKLTSREP